MINEADILSKLKLGTSKEVLTASPKSPLAELLQRIVQDVINQLTERIDHYNIGASNNLRQSLKATKVTQKGNEVSIQISVGDAFYWKFVNFGVNGSEVNHGAPAWGTQPKQEKSFHQAILDWIPTTGTTLPEQFGSYDSWAWAIQESIKKNGKQARPFFTDVVNDALTEAMREPISNLLGRAITVNIVEPWQ